MTDLLTEQAAIAPLRALNFKLKFFPLFSLQQFLEALS
jgi:hypothetical protein